MSTSDTKWSRLEQWSTGAFVLSGLFWLGDATLLGLETLGIYAHGLLNGLLMISAMLTAMVGLLGFYPRLADRVPRVALGSAALAAVGAAGLVVTFVWQIAAMTLSGVGTPPGATAFPPLGAIVLFGVVALWTDTPSRTVGFLLVASVGVLAGAIAAVDWVQIALVGLLGIVVIAVAYVYRTGTARVETEETAPESAA